MSDPSCASIGSTLDFSSLKPESFLPNESEVRELRLNLCVLVGRVLCTYVKCLKPFSNVVPKHIVHPYQSQMSKKSETYFLNVLIE